MSSNKKKGFLCSHCHQFISIDSFIGTQFRNHCPFCLWSRHVDFRKLGDRQSQCQGEMGPIGLTFKHEGYDKYGKPKQGELMVVHQCLACGSFSINRIAADDDPEVILKLFNESCNITDELKNRLEEEGIDLLAEKDKKEIETQLFGKR